MPLTTKDARQTRPTAASVMTSLDAREDSGTASPAVGLNMVNADGETLEDSVHDDEDTTLNEFLHGTKVLHKVLTASVVGPQDEWTPGGETQTSRTSNPTQGTWRSSTLP